MTMKRLRRHGVALAGAAALALGAAACEEPVGDPGFEEDFGDDTFEEDLGDDDF